MWKTNDREHLFEERFPTCVTLSEFSLRINVQLILILKYIKERNIVMTTSQ